MLDNHQSEIDEIENSTKVKLIIVSDETLENNDINFEELKTNERIKKKRIIKDTK